jgi:hypothetical protein
MAAPLHRSARFQVASDQSLLIYFDGAREASSGPASAAVRKKAQNSKSTHERVRRFVRLLEIEPVAGVRNLHPGYSSVLVNFDALKLRHQSI